jgi:transposase
MLKQIEGINKIYLACGYTDLRYGIDGLALLVQETFQLDPFDEGTLFLFCGRRPNKIKGLLWEGDGFLLLYKRIEDGKFMWPRNKDDMANITFEQYHRLLDGLTIESSIRKVHPRTIL